MKILQVNKFFYRRGGADQHFFDLRDLLIEHSQSVVDFSMHDKRNLPSQFESYFVSNVDFAKVSAKSLFNFFRIIYSFEAKRKISSLIEKEKPEVAHLHLIYHHLSPSILPVLKKAKIPTVMTLHDWKVICPNYSLFTKGQSCEKCKGNKFIECAKNKCIHNSRAQSALGSIEAYFHHARKYYENYIDLFIAPSRFVKDKFVEFGWPAKKIRVLPHFLPMNFNLTNEPVLPSGDIRFACISRLSKEKGVDRLVQWWIKNSEPAVLEIFGDGPLRAKIANMIEASGMKNIYLRGQIPREQIFEKIKDVTAVIAPSVGYETFGLTIIESMAKGLPIVASNRGALSELVTISNGGVLFDWDKDDLKEALKASQDPDLRVNALDYMQTHHRPEDYYAEIIKIYKQLTNK